MTDINERISEQLRLTNWDRFNAEAELAEERRKREEAEMALKRKDPVDWKASFEAQSKETKSAYEKFEAARDLYAEQLLEHYENVRDMNDAKRTADAKVDAEIAAKMGEGKKV